MAGQPQERWVVRFQLPGGKHCPSCARMKTKWITHRRAQVANLKKEINRIWPDGSVRLINDKGDLPYVIVQCTENQASTIQSIPGVASMKRMVSHGSRTTNNPNLPMGSVH